LDTGPLGVLTNSRHTAPAVAARQWLTLLRRFGRRVILPEIADYELRREYIRANKSRSLANLDLVNQQIEYLPIVTSAMRKAAELWAAARRMGRPTAPGKDLDGDVILAAQALTVGVPDVLVATTNVAHFAPFVPAELWENIVP
jgi:predicted nucleic acid-binding protein